ncbi:tyrosine-type recombinase/integrase [Agromyces sp. NPDC057865]|uniref:tyrosine-type recombinase/integrase n=1 Tax=Agromyces sp. NPDC057865 TaxID=3346267 RepID=UPI00366C0997
MTKRKSREAFGAIRKLPSGRYQASYIGPDGTRHNAPRTFDAIVDARGWLSQRRAEIDAGKWSRTPATASRTTFGEYADGWLPTRVSRSGKPLRPTTVQEYRRLLAGPLSEFRMVRITAITPEQVRTWYARQQEGGKLTQSARAYTLLKSVLSTAVSEGKIAENPCRIRGAVRAATGKVVNPPTPGELQVILDTIDPRYKALVLIAAWGGLRWGEATELRRKDVRVIGDDVIVLDVSRAVTYTKANGFIIGPPKSSAGVRSVTLPPTVAPEILAHLETSGPIGPEVLLFPSSRDPERHMTAGAFAPMWRHARSAAKRPDLPFHGLRHFGATRFAQSGATLKELQARLGHSTVVAALAYQHEAGRDAELARRMGEMSKT